MPERCITSQPDASETKDLFVDSNLGWVLAGYGAPRPQTVGADHRGETVAFDLLIKGAQVFTGDGPALRADVGVSEGRISAVEPRLPTQTAGEVLDAAGLVLCPGFID